MSAAAVGAQRHADVVEGGGEAAVDGDGSPACGDVARRLCDHLVAAADLQLRAAGARCVHGDFDVPLRGPRVANCESVRRVLGGARYTARRWEPPRMTAMPPSRVTSIASIVSL